jgi:hypothetical protein
MRLNKLYKYVNKFLTYLNLTRRPDSNPRSSGLGADTITTVTHRQGSHIKLYFATVLRTKKRKKKIIHVCVYH